MTCLDPTDARRLRASLAMLASPSDGEKLAAVAAAQRLLDKAGMAFSDLVPAPSAAKANPPKSSAWESCPPKPARVLREHQRVALRMSGHPLRWSTWEQDFLDSIAAWSAPLSARQQAQLDVLISKVDAWRKAQGG